MNAPKCKYKETEIELARYEKPDVGFEDHGFFILYGSFDYLDSGGQGLGYCIDQNFLESFIRVFGVDCLSECTGLVWVEHNTGKIFRIVSVDGKREFDIESWSQNLKNREKRSK